VGRGRGLAGPLWDSKGEAWLNKTFLIGEDVKQAWLYETFLVGSATVATSSYSRLGMLCITLRISGRVRPSSVLHSNSSILHSRYGFFAPRRHCILCLLQSSSHA